MLADNKALAKVLEILQTFSGVSGLHLNEKRPYVLVSSGTNPTLN